MSNWMEFKTDNAAMKAMKTVTAIGEEGEMERRKCVYVMAAL